MDAPSINHPTARHGADALMIYNIARGNTTKAWRTKEDEFEPEDADWTGVHDHEIDASYESEIDLSEESASDSDAECNVEEPEEPEAEPRPDVYSNSAVK